MEIQRILILIYIFLCKSFFSISILFQFLLSNHFIINFKEFKTYDAIFFYYNIRHFRKERRHFNFRLIIKCVVFIPIFFTYSFSLAYLLNRSIHPFSIIGSAFNISLISTKLTCFPSSS